MSHTRAVHTVHCTLFTARNIY